MKKLISLILALCMLCTCSTAALSVTAAAQDAEVFTSGDFTYTVLEDGTVCLSGYTGNASKLTIPAELDGKRVTAIGFRAFSGCDNLTLTVGRDSYAVQYCKEHELSYQYADALDWLNE